MPRGGSAVGPGKMRGRGPPVTSIRGRGAPAGPPLACTPQPGTPRLPEAPEVDIPSACGRLLRAALRGELFLDAGDEEESRWSAPPCGSPMPASVASEAGSAAAADAEVEVESLKELAVADGAATSSTKSLTGNLMSCSSCDDPSLKIQINDIGDDPTEATTTPTATCAPDLRSIASSNGVDADGDPHGGSDGVHFADLHSRDSHASQGGLCAASRTVGPAAAAGAGPTTSPRLRPFGLWGCTSETSVAASTVVPTSPASAVLEHSSLRIGSMSNGLACLLLRRTDSTSEAGSMKQLVSVPASRSRSLSPRDNPPVVLRSPRDHDAAHVEDSAVPAPDTGNRCTQPSGHTAGQAVGSLPTPERSRAPRLVEIHLAGPTVSTRTISMPMVRSRPPSAGGAPSTGGAQRALSAQPLPGPGSCAQRRQRSVPAQQRCAASTVPGAVVVCAAPAAAMAAKVPTATPDRARLRVATPASRAPETPRMKQATKALSRQLTPSIVVDPLSASPVRQAPMIRSSSRSHEPGQFVAHHTPLTPRTPASYTPQRTGSSTPRRPASPSPAHPAALRRSPSPATTPGHPAATRITSTASPSPAKVHSAAARVTPAVSPRFRRVELAPEESCRGHTVISLF
eukprot:gnl/TRDRNA2_/TRDRNA2_199471_c0_seq1.p1 gnl/TRDRNA2_/TRDRNA2_199471_c0~~gnl/TRDRNA2_/TRDRNA2_199471_c0_seq1.p1  ORF type:complete len:650 (-),score=70.27 gnl/TRDRNA2_/TRDRNA2_199471_c0_seq1:120-2003(-)